MDENFHLLNKATIAYNYLHSNSTTHEFLLGAIAELVDNSKDAMADNLHIDYDPKTESLSILDDGCGMTQKEAIKVISFGSSNKRHIPGMIGQYGNGLKSGAMRIANDMIMMTKKEGQLSCLLLSRTFHKEHKLTEVFVPSPSFNAENRHMMCTTDDELRKHRTEMEIIYKYSPFTDQNNLFAQFAKIKGEHGTLIVLYNLRSLMSGDPELDFKSKVDDIRLTDQLTQREEEYNSLRAYLSVLYLEPRMKIYLRGKKITATRLTSNLIMKYKYNYLGKNLKACATKEYNDCKSATSDAEENLRIAQSDLGKFSNTDKQLAEKNQRLQHRILASAVEDGKKVLEECKKREAAAKKAISSPTPLEIVFGLNIHHRNRYGCMFYNNGRLILAYQRGAQQKDKPDLMMKCLGVVAIVNVPYSVLAPTHNKQSFENQREYLSLLKAMNDLMLKYWDDIAISGGPAGVKNFWKKFGYTTSDWNAEPIPDMDGKRNRFNVTSHWIQCNACLKWRRVSAQTKYMREGIPDDWKCSDHPNAANRSCSAAQEIEKIKVGTAKIEKQVEPNFKKNGKVEELMSNGVRSAIDVAVDRTSSRDVPSTSRRGRKPIEYEEEEEDEDSEEEEEEPIPKRKRKEVERTPRKVEIPTRTRPAVKPAVKPTPASTSRNVAIPSRRAPSPPPPRRAPPPPPKPSPASRPSSSRIAPAPASAQSRMVGRAPMLKATNSKTTVTLSSSSEEEEEQDFVPPKVSRKEQPIAEKPPAIKVKILPPVKEKESGPKEVAKSGSSSLDENASNHLPEVIDDKEEGPMEGVEVVLNGVNGKDHVKNATSTIGKSTVQKTNEPETNKNDFQLVRDILQQLAKKGSVDAANLVKMTDEKIREQLKADEMINRFWEEKIQKPLRIAEQKRLEALEKLRNSPPAPPVEKVVEKIVEVEKVPEHYLKLAENAKFTLKWLLPHYHAEMELPPNYEINDDTLFDAMEKMRSVLVLAGEQESPGEQDEP